MQRRHAVLVPALGVRARELEAATDALSSATAARNAAQAQLAAANTKAEAAADSAAQVAPLRAELADLKAQLATSRTALESAQAKIVATPPAPDPERAALTARLEDSQLKLDAALRSFTTLQKENEALRSAAASTVDSAKLETALRSYALLQQENDTLKATAAEVTPLKAQLADAQTRLPALDSEIAELKTRLATATSAPAPTATGENPVELRRQLDDVGNKLGIALRSYTTLAAEHDRLKAAAAERETATAPRVVSTPARPAPAAGTLTPAPALPGVPARQHRVAAGETLERIALRNYNDTARWPEILAANRAQLLADKALLIGRVLVIP